METGLWRRDTVDDEEDDVEVKVLPICIANCAHCIYSKYIQYYTEKKLRCFTFHHSRVRGRRRQPSIVRLRVARISDSDSTVHIWEWSKRHYYWMCLSYSRRILEDEQVINTRSLVYRLTHILHICMYVMVHAHSYVSFNMLIQPNLVMRNCSCTLPEQWTLLQSIVWKERRKTRKTLSWIKWMCFSHAKGFGWLVASVKRSNHLRAAARVYSFSIFKTLSLWKYSWPVPRNMKRKRQFEKSLLTAWLQSLEGMK